MSGVTGKPRQTRLHVLLLAVKSHKKRLGCGHIVDTLNTISTLQRVKRVIDEQAWIISRVVHNLNGSGYTTGLELEVKVADVEYESEELTQ